MHRTFYTQTDFNQMAEAGLNAVRIPLGYWAVVPLIDNEPYVSGQVSKSMLLARRGTNGA